MGDTAVHADSGTRSRKLETASTELKAVRRFYELLYNYGAQFKLCY